MDVYQRLLEDGKDGALDALARPARIVGREVNLHARAVRKPDGERAHGIGEGGGNCRSMQQIGQGSEVVHGSVEGLAELLNHLLAGLVVRPQQRPHPLGRERGRHKVLTGGVVEFPGKPMPFGIARARKLASELAQPFLGQLQVSDVLVSDEDAPPLGSTAAAHLHLEVARPLGGRAPVGVAKAEHTPAQDLAEALAQVCHAGCPRQRCDIAAADAVVAQLEAILPTEPSPCAVDADDDPVGVEHGYVRREGIERGLQEQFRRDVAWDVNASAENLLAAGSPQSAGRGTSPSIESHDSSSPLSRGDPLVYRMVSEVDA